MKTLKCKCGRDILVDDEDFDRVREFNWNCHGGRPVKVTYRRVVLSLPHFVMRTIEQLDHCNRNDHDNQKSNLRLATTEQNNANRGVGKNNTSGFKGVCFVGPRCNASKPWRAGIYHHKKFRCSYHSTAFDAALAYNVAALKYHGEFACLNDLTRDPSFIGPTLPPLREETPLQLSIK